MYLKLVNKQIYSDKDHDTETGEAFCMNGHVLDIISLDVNYTCTCMYDQEMVVFVRHSGNSCETNSKYVNKDMLGLTEEAMV